MTKETKTTDSFPDNWASVKIKDIAEVNAGYGFPKKYQGNQDGNIPFFKVGDISRVVISGSKYLREAEHYVTKDVCNKLKAHPLAKGHVVFAKIGEAIKLNRRAILDQVSLVDNNVIGINQFYDSDENLYLYYFLLTVKLENLSRATTVPSVRKSDIVDLQIPLPPLPEQYRIVDKIEELFSKLDAGMAALEKAQALLKRYRASVLKAACEGRLVPTEAELARKEKRDYEPADALLKRILEERRAAWEGAELAKMVRAGRAPRNNKWMAKYKEPVAPDTSDLPDLPEGWVWTKIDQLGIVSGGVTKNSKREKLPTQVPYLRVANVYADRLDLSEIKQIGLNESELYGYLLQKNDLLVVEGNGSVDQIGRVALWDGSIDNCIHQNHLIKVRFSDNIDKRFVLNWLLSDSGRDFIVKVASSTSGLHTLSISKVSALPVPLPPLQEQRRISDEIDRRLTLTSNVAQQLDIQETRSDGLRQSILKQAFLGKLVPQDPNDEPASVLLERIQAGRAKATPAKRRWKRKTA